MSTAPLAGSALIHMDQHTGRNRAAWLSLAAFLDSDPMRDLSDHARRVASIQPTAARAQAVAPGAQELGQ